MNKRNHIKFYKNIKKNNNLKAYKFDTKLYFLLFKADFAIKFLLIKDSKFKLTYYCSIELINKFCFSTINIYIIFTNITYKIQHLIFFTLSYDRNSFYTWWQFLR